jgi:hypothetical protein
MPLKASTLFSFQELQEKPEANRKPIRRFLVSLCPVSSDNLAIAVPKPAQN